MTRARLPRADDSPGPLPSARKSLAHSSRILCLTSLLLSTRSVAAQELWPEEFSLAPLAEGSTFGVWGSKPLPAGTYAVALGVSIRSAPIAPEPAAAEGGSNGSVAQMEVLGTVGIGRATDLSLGLTARRDGSDTASDSNVASLGDVHLRPRVQLWGDAQGNQGALLLHWAGPLERAAWKSESGLAVEPQFAFGQLEEWVKLAVNLGYRAHPRAEPLGGSDFDVATWGIGLELPVVDGWSAIGEGSGAWHPQGRTAPEWKDFPTETRLGLRLSGGDWAAELGGGSGISGGENTPDWRFMAVLSISPSPLPERHSRAGGLTSASSGFEGDDDPCSVAFARWTGGAIPAACTAEAGGNAAPNPGGEQSPEGSGATLAPHVADGDSQAADACSQMAAGSPETSESGGSSPPCADGSKQSLATLGEFRIHFAPDSARVPPSQFAMLDAVAATMIAAPEGVRFVVNGYSDASGHREFNWRLSRFRASTVRWHLLKRGVPWQRMTTMWYGPSRSSPGVGADIDRRVEVEVERLPP